ncbi:hypothetical protein [Bacteroides timonensis]|uniref:hypothetical protein n=1 Tax=Bacteroides timonensis TaxID=1470345 RepID=UPI0005C5D3E5|nr:hypothetical protein [Bacteroides timonensis]
MDISISINSGFQDEFRIILSPFENSIIPDEIRSLLGESIEIADITLERAKGDNPTNINIKYSIKINSYYKMIITYYYVN